MMYYVLKDGSKLFIRFNVVGPKKGYKTVHSAVRSIIIDDKKWNASIIIWLPST